ncbi:MAG: Uncharacterised protein [SAR116 cluster bacterium]|nr:MAG: Uncharacterised protein [SAR116 cluster bacterium]
MTDFVKCSNNGFILVNASSEPLAIITRSATAAWAPVPLTGQSRRIAPQLSNLFFAACFVSRVKVPVSKTTCPGFKMSLSFSVASARIFVFAKDRITSSHSASQSP